MNEMAFLIFGLLAGGAAVYFFLQSQKDKQALNDAKVALAAAQGQAQGHDEQKRALEAERDEARAKLEEVRATQRTQQADIAALEAQLEGRSAEVQKLQVEQDEARTKLEAGQAAQRGQQEYLARLEEELKNERANAEEKIQLLRNAQEEMKTQFKLLAQDALKESGEKFAVDSGVQLKPLKDGMEAFRKKLDEFQVESAKERTDLKKHIEFIRAEAGKVSASADNLVGAFRGSSKTQGSWGEQALQKLLESCDLKEGENYTKQEAHKTDDGKRQIPDVVIKMPDDKNLIIDSKVSVAAYLDYANAEDDDVREAALQRHLHSINAHVKQLSDKNYNASVPNSMDFVLMFMSPESAYILALQKDTTLFDRAYEKNVVITGVTTLMPILRAVGHLWQTEKQHQNAMAIAERGGLLYDKVAGFVEDMEKLGRALGTARETYDKANNKLQHGKGNLISQAQKLKALGVSTKKDMPAGMLVMDDDEDDEGGKG